MPVWKAVGSGTIIRADMAVPGETEHRAWPRYKVSGKTQCLVADNVNGYSHARLIDLSTTGVMLECGAALPTGLRVELSIDWPQHVGMAALELYAVGETIRSEGAYTAIRIEESSFRVKA